MGILVVVVFIIVVVVVGVGVGVVTLSSSFPVPKVPKEEIAGGEEDVRTWFFFASGIRGGVASFTFPAAVCIIVGVDPAAGTAVCPAVPTEVRPTPTLTPSVSVSVSLPDPDSLLCPSSPPLLEVDVE